MRLNGKLGGGNGGKGNEPKSLEFDDIARENENGNLMKSRESKEKQGKKEGEGKRWQKGTKYTWYRAKDGRKAQSILDTEQTMAEIYSIRYNISKLTSNNYVFYADKGQIWKKICIAYFWQLGLYEVFGKKVKRQKSNKKKHQEIGMTLMQTGYKII